LPNKTRFFEIDLATLKSKNVGEVLQEAKLKLSTNSSQILGLKLKNGTELIDFWLTQPCRSMSIFTENDQLELIFKGIFKIDI